MNPKFPAAGLAVFLSLGSAWAGPPKPKGPTAGAKKPALAPVAVLGTWIGKLSVGPTELTLVLNVTGSAGALRATLDSPDQGAHGIPASGVILTGRRLAVDVAPVGGKFTGALSADGKSLTGEWSQNGAQLPLTLVRSAKPVAARRPQTPRPPFPYVQREVSYPNPAAPGVRLGGTLTIPAGSGRFPVLLFITGSGAQDRDETLFEHKPFAVIADYLARQGIASLRVDDRGVGKSTGARPVDTSADFAGDVRAGVSFLAGCPEVDPAKIGLIGHSEGGLIAPMVAAEDPRVAFIVLLAGPGVPGDQILLEQGQLALKALGMPEATLKAQHAIQELLLPIARAEADPKIAVEKMKAAVPGLPENQLTMFASPWMHFFLNYDPAPTLQKVRCPVLALNGSKDVQVSPSQNLPAVEKALKVGGNAQVTIIELPGLNHLFQTATTGGPQEYGRIEETISPTALRALSEWLQARVK